jgi:ankyrin repeat protein
MDPVGLSSGIAGLISLALVITDSIAKYSLSVKNKDKNIEELRQELDLLGKTLSNLRDFLSSSATRNNIFDQDSVISRAVTDCKARIERIGSKLQTPHKKLDRFLDKLIWPFREEEVSKLMESLRRYRSTFEFACNLQGLRLLQKMAADVHALAEERKKKNAEIQDNPDFEGPIAEAAAKQSVQLGNIIALLGDLGTISEDVREISHAMRLREDEENRQLKAKVLDWLCPLPDLSKHADVQARRADGTGTWLLQTSEYRSWISGSVQNLICVGDPGVGKSVLCSLVVDELRQDYADDNEACVVHYYFDFSEQQLQTEVHLVRSVLRQICVKYDVLPEALTAFYHKTLNAERDKVWFNKLERVFQRIASTYRRIFFVFDALDEADSTRHDGLFQVLNTIAHSDVSDTKVFLTRRPHFVHFDTLFSNSIQIRITASVADIRHYLEDVINKTHSASFLANDDRLKQEILDRLCDGAQGMFLLPQLHLQNILRQATKRDIRLSLNTLSIDLKGVFESTLARIRDLSEPRQRIAFQALLWVSHARRKLTMLELQHALAVRLGDQDLDEDGLVQSEQILEYCCSLIKLEQGGTVDLIHHTLEEYLRQHDHQLFHHGERTILRTCLMYLNFQSLKPIPFKSRIHAEQIMQRLALCRYAATEWGFHARETALDEYTDLIVRLLDDPQKLLVIAKLRDADTPDTRNWQTNTRGWAYEKNGGAGISLAAAFGLNALVEFLIKRQAEPNLLARNMFGSTALHETALCGYERTAQILIDHGANVLETNRGKATPFFLAVAYNQIGMVKCLLKYGTGQVNYQCRAGATALHKAVEIDSEEMVSLLLQSGSLLESVNDKGETPLHVASLRGSLKIVRLLLNAGADVNVRTRDGLIALDMASTAGHAATVEFLLKNNANVLNKGADRWSALHRASRGGWVDTVVLLLENGANLVEMDHRHDYAIHHAARSGNLELVRQLVEYDPSQKEEQLFHRNKRKNTAREVAFFTAQYHVYKYLRGLEWELLGTNMSASNRGTYAIENGDMAELERLLDDGVISLNTPDEEGQEPLHLAVQEKQIAIAKMLLNRGASIARPGYHGWQPIHIAASLADNIDMVELCLQQGADVNARTDSGQQPIHKAASSTSLGTVRLLIDAGANIESTNEAGMTPLLIAAHKNDLATVKALVLEYNADIMARDRNGKNATKWAEKSAHLEVAKFLRQQQKVLREASKPASRARPSRTATWSSDMRTSRESLATVDPLVEELTIEELGRSASHDSQAALVPST